MACVSTPVVNQLDRDPLHPRFLGQGRGPKRLSGLLSERWLGRHPLHCLQGRVPFACRLTLLPARRG